MATRLTKMCSYMCDLYKVQPNSVTAVTLFFMVAWVWHIRIVPTVYSIGGRELMATIALSYDQVDMFREDHELKDTDTSREFAFMASFTHTVVFLFGLVCASLLRRFRRLLGEQTGPTSLIPSLFLAAWIVAIFHSLSWRFLHFCFQTKYQPVFEFAHLFFKDHGGETPFAWASSVSYTTALVLGLLLPYLDVGSNQSQDGCVPGYLANKISSSNQFWIKSVFLPFVVWVCTLDRVVIPFLGTLATEDASSAPRKSIPYFLGLVMCCILPTARRAIRRFASISLKDGMRVRDLHQEIISAVFDVTKTCMVSFMISSVLLTTSLYGELSLEDSFFTFCALLTTFFQWRFLGLALAGVAFGYSVLFLLTGGAKSLRALAISYEPKRWVKDLCTLCFVAFLWNIHLVGFWGSFMPFQVYSYYLSSPVYSHLDAFLDGLVFVALGSYLFPCVFKGMLKVFCSKMHIRWGIAQEILVSFLCTVPLSTMLWYYWANNKEALHLMIGMTVIHLFYLATTTPGRPETTGSRFWPRLRLLGIWELIQYYFDQQIIVDGCNVNTLDPLCRGNVANWPKNRSNLSYPETDARPTPRLIGFSPHGIFPCSVIWHHLTPKWRSVFGDLMPRPLTDSFTHTVPLMRDLNQWAGGLEVTRENVSKCLSKGETIILVPGGQGEILLHTQANLDNKNIVLCGRHKGFVRVAMEHGAELVPAFSFGELQTIKNISIPPVQRLSRKLFGFPFPFWPHGCYLLPIPRAVPMTICIGKPIQTKCKVPGKPSVEEVNRTQKRYFDELELLINKYKKVAGYGDWTVKILHPKPPATK